MGSAQSARGRFCLRARRQIHGHVEVRQPPRRVKMEVRALQGGEGVHHAVVVRYRVAAAAPPGTNSQSFTQSTSVVALLASHQGVASPLFIATLRMPYSGAQGM